MSDPTARLKTCVQCGRILQGSDRSCPSCHAAQPAPGERRPPSGTLAGAAGSSGGTRAPGDSLARSLLLPACAVAVLVALSLGISIVSRKIAQRAGSAAAGGASRGGSGSDGGAAGLAFEAREAGGDAFDRAALGGAARVALDLRRVLEHYEVEGTTATEIFDSIDAHGPDGPDGKAVGLTRMQGGAYSYARDERSGRCVVTSLEATLTITLPRLTTTPLPEPIYERWRDYSAAVAAHEQRHADIYADAALRVAERLRSLQPFADRSAMEAAFTSAWTTEMGSAERSNRDFHRREAQDVALEREIVTNQLQRVERDLEARAARLKAQEQRFPDLRLPPDEYRQHEADRVGYAEGLAERAGLIDRGLWLH